MAHVASSAPEPEDKPISVVRASDNEKSMQQVGQLLNIAGHSGQFLIKPDNFENRVEIDAEATRIARQTFELAHLQLRNLIDEQKRWALTLTPAEKSAEEIIQSSTRLNDQKITNVKLYNRPSIFLRPNVRKFNVGWIAWTGDGLPDMNCLHGIGASPALAMKAFDEAYYDLQKHEPGPAAAAAPEVQPVRTVRKTKKKT